MSAPQPIVTRQLLASAVRRLPGRQRDVFIAHAHDGVTIVEIATRMRISTNEVERLLADAIVRVHRELDADQSSIRNGSIRAGWTWLRRRLSARLRHGRGRS